MILMVLLHFSLKLLVILEEYFRKRDFYISTFDHILDYSHWWCQNIWYNS